MAEEFITVQVHNEFEKRIYEENTRQNHRLSELEQNFKVVQELVISTKELAISMETMANELEKQGNCLRELEFKPAKRWDLVITSVISALVAFLIGIFTKGIMP